MKTKIIALFAILALAFVGLNTTSCSKDDDNSSSSTSDSASCSKAVNDSSSAADSFSLGETDGAEFANAYVTYEAYAPYEAYDSIFVNKLYAITMEYSTKYRNSNDKAYKAGFIAAATGATGLAESQLTNLLGSQSEDALITLLKSLTGTTSSAKVGSDI